MEHAPRQLPPGEKLLYQVEQSVTSVSDAQTLNNEAVRLFTEGKLTIDQLIKFSVALARSADAYSAVIRETDVNHTKKAENKQLSHALITDIAQENRRRAIDLTLSRQQTRPHLVSTPDRAVKK
jgi:hypothetical protein